VCTASKGTGLVEPQMSAHIVTCRIYCYLWVIVPADARE
jgi:hypothetical protein